MEISLLVEALTWAPDESEVAFISGRSGFFHGLDRLEWSTMNLASLKEAWCFSPRYSPDGKYLGFVHTTDLCFDAKKLVIKEIRSGRTKVIAEGVSHWHWCWSQDGSRLFYVRDGGIYQVDVSGAQETFLYKPEVQPPGTRVGHLTVSPDGGELGFCAEGFLCTLNLEDNTVTKLFPCWSSFDWNTSGICYLRWQAGKRYSVMVFNPATGQAREVAIGEYTSGPQWVSKREIVVIRELSTVCVIDILEGTERAIVLSAEELSLPVK